MSSQDSNDKLLEIESTLKKYLNDKKWYIQTCKVCNRDFFAKRDFLNCGSFECENDYKFLTEKKKRIKSIEAFASIGSNFFGNIGYKHVESISPVNYYSSFSENEDDNKSPESPLFTTAGVSLLYDILFNGRNYSPEGIYVAQPVIRTQHVDAVNRFEGNSTSFVNICTEQVNPTPENHAMHLDNWLTYMSKIDLFMGDVRLCARQSKHNWGTGDFDEYILDINYGGLQLGDAAFAQDVPRLDNTPINISDIGFGLERLCWASNKTESYFDMIGPQPYAIAKSRSVIDSIRTLTLMAYSGVTPSRKNQGYRLRQFTKNLLDLDKNPDFLQTIPHYYNYWKNFVKLPNTLEIVENVIINEFERSANIDICEKLGVKTACFDDNVFNMKRNDFIQYLINSSNRGIKLEDIKKVI